MLNRVLKTLMVLLFFVSCTQDKEQECVKCKEAQSIKARIKMNLFNSSSSSFSLNIKYWHKPNSHYASSLVKLEDEVVSKITEYALSKGVKIGGNVRVVSAILYSNTQVTDGVNISDENIKGLSLYTIEKNSMKHRLFKKDKDTFIELKEYTKGLRAVTISDARNCLNKGIIPDKTIKSYIICFGREYTKFRKSNKRMFIGNNNKNNTNGGVSFARAGDPCAVGYEGCEDGASASACEGSADMLDTDASFDCTHVCLMDEYKAGIGASDTIVSIFLDFELMKRFRDDFLYTHQSTVKYVNLYYQFSAFLVDKIDLQISLKTINILSDFNYSMEKLLNANAYSNHIVVDNNLKTKLIDLVNDYRNLSNDIDYNTALNGIEQDIINYSNKTVSQVLSSL